MTQSVDQRADAIAGLLSETWQATLGRPPSTWDTDFFVAGGDSLLIVRMVSQLRKAGITAGPADFLRGRTFSGVLERLRASNPRPGPTRPRAAAGPGPVPLLPSQHRWIANRFAEPGHFALAWVFRVPGTTPEGGKVDTDRIDAAVRALVSRHDTLRTRYHLTGPAGPWAEVLGQAPDGLLQIVDTGDDGVAGALRQGMAGHRLAGGRVLTASWLPAQRLLQIAVHHLALDGYSLAVLADDLEDLLIGREITGRATQPRDYAADLASWTASGQAGQDGAGWAKLGWAEVRRITADTPGPGLLPSMATEAAELDAERTAALQRAAGDLGQPVDVLVLVAAGRVIADRFGLPAVSVDTYHHGRDGVPGGHDLTETIGYIQCTYPVVVHAGPPGSWLAQAGTDLAALPSAKFGFDALRFAGDARLTGLAGSGIRMNFRSRMNELNCREGGWLRPASVPAGGRRSPRQQEPYLLMLEGDLVADRLVFTIKYSQDHFAGTAVRALAVATTELLAAAGRGRQAAGRGTRA